MSEELKKELNESNLEKVNGGLTGGIVVLDELVHGIDILVSTNTLTEDEKNHLMSEDHCFK